MFVEDVSVFFTDFAETVNIGGTDTLAIFNSPYSTANVGIGMDTAQPSLTMPTANVPPNPIGALAIVRATNYSVESHMPDGTGVSRLMLERA